MLSELKISNFAIAESLDVEFHSQFNTITGETGAGKSIMIDALSMALGERADTSTIGQAGDKAQIIATFNIKQNKAAQQWLEEKSLDADGECILRRVLDRDGKSRAFINGVPSPLQDVKALSERLINIHSQHQHQQLLHKENHRELLDAYSENQLLVKAVQNQFRQWQTCQQKLDTLKQNQSNRLARIEFLNFQLEELDKLDLQENEYQSLSDEHKKLANMDQDIQLANECLSLINGDGENPALNGLYKVQQIFQNLSQKHLNLRPTFESIGSAIINIEEAYRDLENYLRELEGDPEMLSRIDERLSQAHHLARKHHIKAEQLFEYHQTLKQELHELENADETLSTLEQETETLKIQFQQTAQQLSEQRKKSATKLDKAVSKQFKALGMDNAKIETRVNPLVLEKANQFGTDEIEILIATNPGQKPQSLSKIASGGELSRVSLAIQVNFAQKSSLPCMIFDEVDVGIGGATAEVVGKLLRELSTNSQVICVTHLAQVAAQGHHHYKIEKRNENKHNVTKVSELKEKDRVSEIARMIGGVELTAKTQSHAQEMLKMAR